MYPTARSVRASGGILDGGGVMTTVEADGVTLGVEHFGDAAAPLVLLAGGTTMLSWPDALCATLARGGRHVVRYDLRDSGASTTVDPEAPSYTLRDLAADAAALARELDDRPAHLAGIGVGGMVAQVAALEHPDAFSALTLAGTRPVAPGRVDEDLPDHDAATMKQLYSRSMPDWSDRAAVAEFAAGGAVIRGDDPAAARAIAARIWDRTPGTRPAVHMANQMGMVFSKLNCKPRWRQRLPELAIPALVVHGRHDPFFPVGNGEALAREIPMRGCSCSNRLRSRFPTRPPAKSRRRCARSRRLRGSARVTPAEWGIATVGRFPVALIGTFVRGSRAGRQGLRLGSTGRVRNPGCSSSRKAAHASRSGSAGDRRGSTDRRGRENAERMALQTHPRCARIAPS